jgi:hypothetical protein
LKAGRRCALFDSHAESLQLVGAGAVMSLVLLAVLVVMGVIAIVVLRTHRTTIRGKDAQIERLQLEIDGYKEKLAGADQAAAKMAALEKQVGARRTTEPRVEKSLPALTGAQISEWSDKLAAFKVTALYIRALEHSPQDFRDSLHALFSKAGWPGTTVGNVAPANRTTISSRGAREAALALVEMFKSVGANVDHQEFQQLFPGHSAIWITVECRGSKRSPAAAATRAIAA